MKYLNATNRVLQRGGAAARRCGGDGEEAAALRAYADVVQTRMLFGEDGELR